MARKFGGRPQEREPEPGRRTHLSLAVTADIKRKLEDAAVVRGCSVSTEASSRLESTFTKQEILPELMSFVFPKGFADFCFEAYRAGLSNLPNDELAAFLNVARQDMKARLKALPPMSRQVREKLQKQLATEKQRAK